MKRKLQITILSFAVLSSSMFVAAFIIERTASERAWHSPLVDLLSIQDRNSVGSTELGEADEFEQFLEDMMFNQLKYGVTLPQSPDGPPTRPAARVTSLTGTPLETSSDEDSNPHFE